MHVAHEAWWILFVVFAAGIGFSLGLDSPWPWVVAGLLATGVATGFRDSDRVVPPQPLGLVAPVDGEIIHRRECHDPYLDRAAIRLSIAVRRWGVYYLRAPTEGTLQELKLGRQRPHASQASWIRTDEGDDIILVVSEGSLLGQRPCAAEFGQRVGQGRRCGMRRLARRLDVYIPSSCRVDVEMGEKVRAGSDVLATMVHNVPKIEAEQAA